MTTFAREFIKAAKEAPKLYIAVLVGAIRGAREEWDRVIAESRGKTANRSSETGPE